MRNDIPQTRAPAHDAGAGATHAEHTHSVSGATLRLGFFLTVLILAVEVAGGLTAHSLALLSDAGHIVTDVFALGLAWFAAAQAERPANARQTFGYHRVGILTALANGLTLIIIAGAIAFEAYRRLVHPEAVQPLIMVGAAVIALAVNLFIVRNLHGAHSENLNVRAALLHVIGDIGASLGVVVGAVAILFTGADWVDPVVSLLIAVLIALGSLRLIREAINILLEAAPRGISTPQVARDMRQVRGVRAVHDLHIWTISSGMRALSCHAVIDDIPPSESAPILDKLAAMLRNNYRITHTTIQFESEAHDSHEGFCACPPGSCETLYCELRTPDAAEHAHDTADGHTHAHV